MAMDACVFRSRRTYGTPSFHFLEQGLKPLPIVIQSLRDEIRHTPRKIVIQKA